MSEAHATAPARPPGGDGAACAARLVPACLATFMSAFVAAVVTALNTGVDAHLPLRWLSAWAAAWPAAIVAAYAFRPLALRCADALASGAARCGWRGRR